MKKPWHNQKTTPLILSWLASLVLVSSAIILFYITRVEPFYPEMTIKVTILPRLGNEFNGLRIVHISDIHYDSWMTLDQIANIVEKINELQPDLVVITGDFIYRDTRLDLDGFGLALRNLKPRVATLAVLGNHDHTTDPVTARRIIGLAGITELNNRVVTFQRGSSQLHIAGLDDVYVQKHDLDQVIHQIPTPGTAILLVHEPDIADTIAKNGRFDLQLSGHTHGGQIVLPFWGSPTLPRHGRKYSAGLYQVNTLQVYTNRGIGMASPRVRFNCPPEITLLTLAAKP